MVAEPGAGFPAHCQLGPRVLQHLHRVQRRAASRGDQASSCSRFELWLYWPRISGGTPELPIFEEHPSNEGKNFSSNTVTLRLKTFAYKFSGDEFSSKIGKFAHNKLY